MSRDILSATDYNPTLVGKTISFDVNSWLNTISRLLPQLKYELAKVETDGSIKENKSSLDREQSLVSVWCAHWIVGGTKLQPVCI